MYYKYQCVALLRLKKNTFYKTLQTPEPKQARQKIQEFGIPLLYFLPKTH